MRMASIIYLIAAVLSVLGAVAHEVLGAPKALAPLANSNLPADIVWLHHFSWHVGTVSVLAMAVLFILAGRGKSGQTFAVIATSMSAGYAAIAISLALFSNPVLWTTPAPYPWALITVLGLIGIFTQSRINR